MKQPPSQAFEPGVNRIGDVMSHISRYSFHGIGRLAHDAGLNPSSVSRLINGKVNPSFFLISRIAGALENQLGHRLDLRDLIAENGEFPTRYACDLTGCRGCLPESSTDEHGNAKRAFEGVKPGRWVTSRHPRGYLTDNEEEKGGENV